MGTRQYIGARYVPKFYDGSAGTDWTANTQYEPLTIVTRNGNSYTSKKPVPASVGAPESNPDYWASTGIYNQQVEEIRQEFQQLREETEEAIESIDDLTNLDSLKGHLLFIGDSYITALSTSWADIIAQRLGKVQNSTYFKSAKGGTGFAALAENVDFTSLVTSAVTVDDDKISAVFFGGGSNDIYTANLPGIKTGIARAVSAAKTRFPNATIYITMTDGWVSDGFTENTRETLYNNYQIGAVEAGAKFLGASGSGLKIYRRTLLQEDLKHPSAAGMTDIANMIMLAITGQKLKRGALNQGSYYVTMEGDEVIVNFYGNFSYSTTIDSLSCNGATQVEIPFANNLIPIVGDTERSPGFIQIAAGNKYYLMPCAYSFSANGLLAFPRDMNDDHTNFRTIENVRQIVIPTGTVFRRNAINF